MHLNSQDTSILDFIPSSLPEKYLSSPSDFSRTSKLGVRETIAFICMLVSSGLNAGLRSHISHYLSENSSLESLNVSSISRARHKIKPSTFQTLHRESVKYLYQNWTDSKYDRWDRKVIAVDGSKFVLPSSQSIKDAFDDKSLRLSTTHGYYPQCLVTTFYDVFRKIPINRTVTKFGGSERGELLSGLQDIPESSILIVDRGYYGFDLFNQIQNNSSHDIIARVPFTSSFSAVKEFANGGEKEAVLSIKPTAKYKAKVRVSGGKIEDIEPLTMRAIRYTPKDGAEDIILLTTLLDAKKFETKKIAKLYWDRWQVELGYRDEKTYVEANKFHSKSVDGVLQELYSYVFMSVITKYFIYKKEKKSSSKGEPQFLNAITTLARKIPKLLYLKRKKSMVLFNKIMRIILSIRYYRQANRESYPRLSKQPRKRWNDWGKNNRLIS